VDFVQRIGELLAKAVPRHVLSGPVLRALAMMASLPSRFTGREPPITPEIAWMLSTNTVCSSARAERELGCRPMPLREMLQDAHRWLVAEGLLPVSSSDAFVPPPH